jgi:SAM-dependent methyltransferase
MDISIRALREAEERIGDHGLFVVGDVARLPFKSGAFDGEVSLHTVHHLPPDEHQQAFFELNRALAEGGRAVVVTSWGTNSALMRFLRSPINLMKRLLQAYQRIRGIEQSHADLVAGLKPEADQLLSTAGTFTAKHTYHWTKSALQGLPTFNIFVWRSVNTNFLRAFVHRRFFGKGLLRMLFWFEELAPRFFGRIGQYPMITFEKPRGL